jgi:hypothetical protein
VKAELTTQSDGFYTGLCESRTDYTVRWFLYTGSDPVSWQGLDYDVVTRLVEPFYNIGYHVYMDNYFSSPVLFQELAHQQTGACGTVRVNRQGVPQVGYCISTIVFINSVFNFVYKLDSV